MSNQRLNKGDNSYFNNQLVNYIVHVTRFKFIFLVFLLGIAFTTILSISMSILIPKIVDNPFLKESLTTQIFFLVLIAPILETFFLQYALIEIILYSRIKERELIACLVSGIAFGLLHNYNLIYMISGIAMGVFFASTYIVSKKRKDINAFVLIWLLHAFINLIVIILNYIF